jgi:hypothetical protein
LIDAAATWCVPMRVWAPQRLPEARVRASLTPSRAPRADEPQPFGRIPSAEFHVNTPATGILASAGDLRRPALGCRGADRCAATTWRVSGCAPGAQSLPGRVRVLPSPLSHRPTGLTSPNAIRRNPGADVSRETCRLPTADSLANPVSSDVQLCPPTACRCPRRADARGVPMPAWTSRVGPTG